MAKDFESEYKRALKKSKEAADEKKYFQKKADEYSSQKSALVSKLPGYKTQKLNLEKRLEEVYELIKMMSDSGGLFSKNVPDKIRNSNQSADDSYSKYKGCIKASSDGGAQNSVANIADKFHSDDVYSDPNSQGALQAFQEEKRRIENAIAEIDSQIRKMEATIEELKSLIKTCENNWNYWKKEENRHDNDASYYLSRM